MDLLTTYRYTQRNIVDPQSIIKFLRFLFINAILALIFLFLALEEVDWVIFSSRASIKDSVNDNTSWNINKIFDIY